MYFRYVCGGTLSKSKVIRSFYVTVAVSTDRQKGDTKREFSIGGN